MGIQGFPSLAQSLAAKAAHQMCAVKEDMLSTASARRRASEGKLSTSKRQGGAGPGCQARATLPLHGPGGGAGGCGLWHQKV